MRALMMAAALATGACAMAGDSRLAASEWQATSVNGAPLVAGSRLTLRLEGGRASGSAGCNRYFASYETGARQGISFTGVGSTRMACAEPLMDQERRFLNILENASGYNFYRSGELNIIAADGRVIRFRRSG